MVVVPMSNEAMTNDDEALEATTVWFQVNWMPGLLRLDTSTALAITGVPHAGPHGTHT